MPISKTRRPLRILDFDIENRPLSYWYDGMTTAEVTAIAASWADSDEIACWALSEPLVSVQGVTYKCDAYDMLAGFMQMYDQADIVTGHYIRKHDLPILNAAMLEEGLLPLEAKLTIDTKMDLVRLKDLSASQEALGAMFGLEHPKVSMTQQDWRKANRLTPEGIRKTRERVIGDVKQHKELRLALAEAGALGPPKVWRP